MADVEAFRIVDNRRQGSHMSIEKTAFVARDTCCEMLIIVNASEVIPVINTDS
jgi:hypothetical protein